MDVTLADTRDETWRIDSPRYRVQFWTLGRSLDLVEYEISQADVDEVIQWARANAEGRSVVIYVALPEPAGSVGFVRILGRSPDRDD